MSLRLFRFAARPTRAAEEFGTMRTAEALCWVREDVVEDPETYARSAIEDRDWEVEGLEEEERVDVDDYTRGGDEYEHAVRAEREGASVLFVPMD